MSSLNPKDAAGLRAHIESGLLDGVILAQVQLQDARARVLSDAAVPFVMMGRTADNTSARAQVVEW